MNKIEKIYTIANKTDNLRWKIIKLKKVKHNIANFKEITNKYSYCSFGVHYITNEITNNLEPAHDLLFVRIKNQDKKNKASICFENPAKQRKEKIQ